MPVPQPHSRKRNTWVRDSGTQANSAEHSTATHHVWKRKANACEEPRGRVTAGRTDSSRELTRIAEQRGSFAQRPLPSRSTAQANEQLRQRSATTGTPAGLHVDRRSEIAANNSYVRPVFASALATDRTVDGRLSRNTLSQKPATARLVWADSTGNDAHHPRNKLQQHIPAHAAAMSSVRHSRGRGGEGRVGVAAPPRSNSAAPARLDSRAAAIARQSKKWVRPEIKGDASARVQAPHANQSFAFKSSCIGAPRTSRQQQPPVVSQSASRGGHSKVWLSEAAAAARPVASSSCSYRPEQPSWASPPSKKAPFWLQHLLRLRRRSSLLSRPRKGTAQSMSWQIPRGAVRQRQQVQQAVSQQRKLRASAAGEAAAPTPLSPLPALTASLSGRTASGSVRRSMGRGKARSWVRGKGAAMASPSTPHNTSSLTRSSSHAPKVDSRWQPSRNRRSSAMPAKLERLGGHLYRVGGVGRSKTLQRQGTPPVTLPTHPSHSLLPTPIARGRCSPGRSSIQLCLRCTTLDNELCRISREYTNTS